MTKLRIEQIKRFNELDKKIGETGYESLTAIETQEHDLLFNLGYGPLLTEEEYVELTGQQPDWSAGHYKGD